MRTHEHYVAFVSRAVALLLIAFANSGCATPSTAPDRSPTVNAKHPEIIKVDGRDLQRVLDAAPPYSFVLCNRNQPLTLSTPVTIRKPLTLQGFNAQLPKGLIKTPLLVVEAEGVAITDFELTGNGNSIPQKDRCALLVIRAGGFRVERGVFVNSSKDGVMIDGPSVEGRDIVGGTVRDIVGRGCIRDVVSIGGGGVHGHRIRNVLVDNVRGYDSSKRGAVEVSDGTDNITVRKVYAEKSVYAVDIQDHSKPGEINSNVVVEDVFALDCTHAIRTANQPLGHSNLTLRDITAQRCNTPLKISNTSNVTLQNVRILDHPAGKPPISISDCDGVSIRDIAVGNSIHPGPALLIENCNDTLIDGLILQTGTSALSSGVCFRAARDETFSGLRIHHVRAQNVTSAGILLERSGKAELTDYIISDNLARVLDRIQGQHAVVADNLQ
jgi:hypothetical protein